MEIWQNIIGFRESTQLAREGKLDKAVLVSIAEVSPYLLLLASVVGGIPVLAAAGIAFLAKAGYEEFAHNRRLNSSNLRYTKQEFQD